MRFRGTLILVALCAALGAFVYFYEIRGGEKRSKAETEAKQIWKVESADIQQIDLTSGQERISAVRSGEKQWKITAPRAVEADGAEMDRLAGSASSIARESVTEQNAADLGKYGLDPPQHSLSFKTKEGREYTIHFGNTNPTGSSTYAVQGGSKEVLLVASYTATGLRKTLDELRNHMVLAFDQYDAQTLDFTSSKGAVRLSKENDRWYLQGKEKWLADSSETNTLLSALSSGRLKEFFEDNPEDYQSLGFENPLLDIRVTLGKDKAIKHLQVGLAKSELARKGSKPARPAAQKSAAAQEKQADTSAKIYVARDESRNELFCVDQEFIDKFLKSPADLRNKALAAFQRWDIDTIVLTNPKGTFTFAKSDSGGDWLLGEEKKKAKWDAVNGILDVLEKPVRQFVEDGRPASAFGLETPAIRVVLKQKGEERVNCALGGQIADGVYAQVKGESAIKLAEKGILEKLELGMQDFLEPPPAPAATPTPSK